MGERPIRSAIRRRLLNLLDDAVGQRLGAAEALAVQSETLSAQRLDGIEARLTDLARQMSDLVPHVAMVRAAAEQGSAPLQDLVARVAEIRDITGQHLDRIPELRAQLIVARQSDEYGASFTDEQPLVSVRIATYDRAEILFDRTLPSVFAQTYPHIEVIVVGDGCAEETVRRAAAVTDPRFRFVNLPHRGVYPADPAHRWLVAGSPAMNYGAELSRGRWIAPLDDDDEFLPDHVETLLRTAREAGFEMVHGRMAVVAADGSATSEIGSYPPAYTQFGFQAAMYLGVLKFFEYETSSWVLGEPGDWNLCRRMMQAGVLIGYTPDVITTLYPAGPS